MNNSGSEKKISIVLTVHNQAEELRQNLTSLLTQNYEAGYEVIVVDESSTDGSADVLKHLKLQYQHLYITYIPSSSHYLSRRKLALTVGVKAAHNEWIIITSPSCHASDDSWLAGTAEVLTSDFDTVCFYTPYDNEAKSRYAYLRALTWWRQLGRPYCYDGACLAIRKSVFMERNGFQSNLRFLRSEYDFLVNETADERLGLCRDASCCLRQQEPSPKEWTRTQLYAMQAHPHLGHAFSLRVFFALIEAGLYLGYLLPAGLLVWAAMQQNYTLVGVAALLLLVMLALRTFFAHRMVKNSGEHISLWKLPWLDLGVVWHYAYYRLRYALSDKYEFTRK